MGVYSLNGTIEGGWGGGGALLIGCHQHLDNEHVCSQSVQYSVHKL